MKLLVQWATKHPRGWIEIDSSEWASLPKKPVPVGGEVIDDAPGWLNDVCVQGMCSGTVDHVAIEDRGDSVRMTLWRDDPEDYTPDEYSARVITFHPLRPDPALGGAINTHIESVYYAGPERCEELKAQNFANSEVRPWSEFVLPPEKITRHGIWLSEDNAVEHLRIRRTVSWREWGEGGDVPCQRDLGRWERAKGTITYYWRGTDLGGSGDDAYMGDPFDPAIGQNFRLTKNSTTVNDVTRDILQLTTDEISFAWTTESGEPNDADWPTGDYRAQIDINGLEGGDVTCKTVILQVTSTGSIRGTFGTSSPAYDTTGLKLFTVSSHNPGAGATSDRYQIRVLGTNTYTHQARLLTLGVRTTDSYADGPWTVPIQTGDTRDARTKGKETDYGDSRDARTAGKESDFGSNRSARTEGQITTGDSRAARTAGKETGYGDSRSARTLGGITVGSSRDARTAGKETDFGSTRAARTEGTTGGTVAGSTRSARTRGIKRPKFVDKTIDASSVPRDGFSFSHTVPAGTDRYLLVHVGHLSGETCSAVTYDGDPLTQLATYEYSGMGFQVFGRMLGTSGSQTVADVVVTSSTGDWDPSFGVAANFVNVDQTNPIGELDETTVTSGSTRNFYGTTESTYSLLVSLVIADDGASDPIWGYNSSPDVIQEDLWSDKTGTGGEDVDVAFAGIALPTSELVGEDQYNNSIQRSTDNGEFCGKTFALNRLHWQGPVYVSHTIDKSSTARSSATFSHTVPAGDDRYLVVQVHLPYNEDASGVTYDGNALSLIGSQSSGSGNVKFYGKTMGTSGSQTVANVVVTFTSSCACDAQVAVSLENVDQADPVGATDGATGGTYASFNFTTETANSLMLYAAMCEGDDGYPMLHEYNRGARRCTELWDEKTGGGENDANDLSFCGGPRPTFDLALTENDLRVQASGGGSGVTGFLAEIQGPHEEDSRAARTAGKESDFGDSRDARTAGKESDFGSTRSARTEGTSAGTQVGSSRDARTAGKETDYGDSRDARTEGQITTGDSRDARTAGQVTTGDSRNARTAGQVTTGDSRNARTAGKETGFGSSRSARTEGQVTTGSSRSARTEGTITGTQTSDSRDARTAGKETNFGSSRDARTAGKETDSGDSRDARTVGKETGFGDSRDARTAGKETGYGDTRAARTVGAIVAGSTRSARTEGKITGTQVSSSRDARTVGKEADYGDSRDARTAGKETGYGDSRDARTAGKETGFGDSRAARTAGKELTSSSRNARTEGKVTGTGAQGIMNKIPTGNITYYGEL